MLHFIRRLDISSQLMDWRHAEQERRWAIVFCENCGEKLPEEARVCTSCGKSVGHRDASEPSSGPRVLYSSKGCLPWVRKRAYLIMVLVVAMAACLIALSFAQRSAWSLNNTPATMGSDGSLTVGTLKTVQVDVFSDTVQLWLRVGAVAWAAIVLSAGASQLANARRSEITVSTDGVSGVPFIMGFHFNGSAALARIGSSDIVSFGIENKRLGSVQIRTTAGRKLTFLCLDTEKCINALRDAVGMR